MNRHMKLHTQNSIPLEFNCLLKWLLKWKWKWKDQKLLYEHFSDQEKTAIWMRRQKTSWVISKSCNDRDDHIFQEIL